MSKTAVILAGGKGTRLRPYTVVLPKPLMPIGDYPILEVIIRQLAYYEFDRIVLAVNHQADLIKSYFGNGEKWRLKIEYSLEDRPLSTIAPLKLIHELPEDFLIMNGDILTDLDFSKFWDEHVKNKNIFTISAAKRELHSEYGVLEINQDNKLSGFKEKPVLQYDVSMGIYMANRRILQYIPENSAYGFDQLMLDLLASKNPASVIRQKCYWLDIGRPDDYIQAIDEFEALKERFLKC